LWERQKKVDRNKEKGPEVGPLNLCQLQATSVERELSSFVLFGLKEE